MWNVGALRSSNMITPGYDVAYNNDSRSVVGKVIYSRNSTYGRFYFVTMHNDYVPHMDVRLMAYQEGFRASIHMQVNDEPLYSILSTCRDDIRGRPLLVTGDREGFAVLGRTTLDNLSQGE